MPHLWSIGKASSTYRNPSQWQGVYCQREELISGVRSDLVSNASEDPEFIAGHTLVEMNSKMFVFGMLLRFSNAQWGKITARFQLY